MGEHNRGRSAEEAVCFQQCGELLIFKTVTSSFIQCNQEACFPPVSAHSHPRVPPK
jgi:hypothetical protein